MARHGVEKSVAVHTTGICHSFESGNEATLAALSSTPSILPAATIDPRGWLNRLPAEINNFRLVRFFPTLQGWPIRSLAFQDALVRVAEVGLPSMVKIDRKS